MKKMDIFKNQIVKTEQKRFVFNIVRESQQIETLVQGLPENEVYKMISCGGFSSIGFIKFIADRTKVKEMTVSTLRVGRKHLIVLNNLHKQGKIEKINFIVGSIMKNDSDTGKKYGYFNSLENVCAANGWNIVVMNNHSKILLFDTENGKFVIETSSNLNENPNMEQFSFEKNPDLYDAYINAFRYVLGGATEWE